MSGQMAHGSGRPEPFRLLFVCSGNVCCSAFAQLHTRALLDVRLGRARARWFSVASAGTEAAVGSTMHPGTLALLGTRATHSDVRAFRSRQLPVRDVRLADLVLTADRRRRAAVLELEPRALPSTFTLREFVRLLASLDPPALPRDPLERARALVAAAGDQRGCVPPVPAEDDAVPDPTWGGVEDHAAAAHTIDVAVRHLVAVVAGGAPDPVPPSSPRSAPTTPPPGPPYVGSVHVGPIRLGAGTSTARSAPVPTDEPVVTEAATR